MQTKYPAYVTPVQSNDEYSDEPTHCSFEVAGGDGEVYWLRGDPEYWDCKHE